MSENIKSILADSRKSKTLFGQILLSNRLGVNPVLKLNGKRVQLVRVSPLKPALIKSRHDRD